MTLFLAAVFQKGHEPSVLAHYHLLSLWVARKCQLMDTGSDKSNALRALVVHPDYAEDHATAALVDYLDQIQEPSGCWPVPIPFFLTVQRPVPTCTSNRRTGNGTWRWKPYPQAEQRWVLGQMKTANGIPFLSSMP